MRNLKKVLSLALAMVMLLGMMVVGASAELAYKDADSITKKEAVEVMTALGILTGDETGFRPTGTLKRSEAAKILVFVADGSVVANALGQADTQFSDVPATHWASGFVAYCANLGIISGVDATHFNPDGELTSQEFAKMLLVAMGGDEANYVGSTWATNVRRDAIKAKINENADITLWDKAITRDQAAQMALNALTSTLDGGKTVYVVNDVEFDDIKDAAIFGAVQEPKVSPTQKVDTTGTLGAKNFGLKQEVTSDKLGNKITKWTANGNVEIIVDMSSDALLTIAGEDYKAGTVNDSGRVTTGSLKGYTEGKDFESWYNGSEIESEDAKEYYTNIGSIRGATIKVYGSGTTMTKVVIEEPYFTKVAKVDTKKNEVTLNVYEAGRILNEWSANGNAVKPYSVTIREDDEDYALVKDMAKDDVFMGIFQPGWNNARTGENATYGLLVAVAGVPEAIEGKVTAKRITTVNTADAADGYAYNSSTITLDGERYKTANEYSRVNPSVGNEGTLYVYGDYAYHFDGKTEAASTDYALIVKAFGTKTGSLDSNAVTVEARVLLSDGTYGNYKLATDNDGKVKNVSGMTAVTETKEITDDKLVGKVFNYTLDDDDVMTLGTAVKDTFADKTVANVTLGGEYKGATSATFDSNKTALFNNSTVFVLYTVKGSTGEDAKTITSATLRTGPAALGSNFSVAATDADVIVTGTSATRGIANVVFAKVASAPTVSTGDLVYVDATKAGQETVDDKVLYAYDGVRPDGETVTVYGSAVSSSGDTAVTDSGVYELDEDNKIVGSKLTDTNNVYEGEKEKTTVDNGMIQVTATGKFFNITEETETVIIASGAELETGCTSTIVVDEHDNVTVIYVTAAKKAD